MQKKIAFLVALVVGVGFVASAWAGVPKAQRKMIKQKLKGEVLYMKVDAPCVTGRHPFGVYYSPLVEVSPDGVNVEEKEGVGVGWYHADSAHWGISVNDPVEFDDIEFDGNVFELELVGVQEAEDEVTVLKFVDIESYDDFAAAFEHVFATRPLQELHDDWPQEIKTAISKGRLQEGMSKRQVYYITGAPERFETFTEDGMEVEVWTLRNKRGAKMGFFRMNTGAPPGAQETLRFEDGRLVNVVGRGTGAGLDLDD